MKTLIHKILYKTLPLEGYLRAVSRMFFLWQRLGIGRYAPATEYVYHLPQLVHAGDTAIEHRRLQRSQFGIARNGPRCQPSRAGDGCGISLRIETQQMRGQEAALRESHGNHRPSGGNMLRNPCINGLGGFSRLLV